jgi:CubicO group peptidase (beta-lactamase class C family)
MNQLPGSRFLLIDRPVHVFDHGKIIWTRAHGLADMATKKPVTSETQFQEASISKPVRALAAPHLVQEGKLSLDENVNDKLRAWRVPDNQFTAQQSVIVLRILSHTTGGHACPCHQPSKNLEARVGFEPTSDGFADHSLRPLGYRA